MEISCQKLSNEVEIKSRVLRILDIGLGMPISENLGITHLPYISVVRLYGYPILTIYRDDNDNDNDYEYEVSLNKASISKSTTHTERANYRWSLFVLMRLLHFNAVERIIQVFSEFEAKDF